MSLLEWALTLILLVGPALLLRPGTRAAEQFMSEDNTLVKAGHNDNIEQGEKT